MYMIFASLAPIFLIILAGFVIERLSFLPQNTGDILSFFSINICIPCLLFHIMCTTSVEQFSQVNWWIGMVGPQVIGLALFYCLERYVRHAGNRRAVRRRPRDDRTAEAFRRDNAV